MTALECFSRTRVSKYGVNIPFPHSSDALRPADLLVMNTSVGCPVALDASLVHPLQHSLSQAAALPGVLALQRAQHKVSHYHQACGDAGWRFVPAVFETTGGHNPWFNPFGKMWVRRMSMMSGSSVAYRGGWGPQGWAATAGSGFVRVRPHVKYAYSAGERPKAPVRKEP